MFKGSAENMLHLLHLGLTNPPTYFPERITKNQIIFFPIPDSFLSTFGKNYIFFPEITPKLWEISKKIGEKADKSLKISKKKFKNVTVFTFCPYPPYIFNL